MSASIAMLATIVLAASITASAATAEDRTSSRAAAAPAPLADPLAGCLPAMLQTGPAPGPVAQWAARCGPGSRSILDAGSYVAAGLDSSFPPCVPVVDALLDDACETWVGIYDHPGAYSSPGYGTDSPADFAVSPDGDRIFVTGVSWGGAEADYDWATVAFDAAGQRLWTARRGTTVDGQFSGMDFPMSIAASPMGDTVFVTGMHDFHLDPEYAGTAATVAYDAATGEERWVALFDGPPDADFLDIGAAVTVSPDGALVLVAAQTQTGPTPSADFGFGQYPSDYAIVAYDSATGDLVWDARFGDTADGWRPNAIAVDPNGEAVYVTGHAIGGREIATVAYALGSEQRAAGEELWVSRYASDQIQEVNDLKATRNRVIVSGGSLPTGAEDFRLLLLAYDTSGGSAWTARYPEDGGGGAAFGSQLAVSPDGERVFLSGTLTPVLEGGVYANPDYGIAAYEAETGSRLWSSPFDGSAGAGAWIDVPRAIAVAPDGRDVYVTGQSGAATSWTYWGFDLQPAYIKTPYGSAATTVALDAATGNRSWVARFDPSTVGEGGAFGYGIAFGTDRVYTLAGVSARGSVDNWIDFFCGAVTDTCSPLDANMGDYAVLAYDAG